ncbi:DUF7342 family protein [Natronocalculus amylovorans]|uniref:ArsR family transcriptional regulator n=1 Tax=Natronocalculus amylovorans TaxID=2917812 RepID=A0AAE3K8E5_9EURY|nr:hypothetical protein [Natronocalculus amylovorans]MCL9816971.1 hypothetical protein [Natronocalculus amylovorans]
MSEDTPAPPDMDLTGEWDKVIKSRTVKDRVYEAVTTLTSPTAVSDVAERADCTKEGARPHLEWFVDVGVLEKVAHNPALFVRNEAYFEFRRITELVRELETPDAVENAIDEYHAREEELSSYFTESSPEAVIRSEIRNDDSNKAYDRLSEWRAVTRRLRELREAKFRIESNHSGAPVSSFP